MTGTAPDNGRTPEITHEFLEEAKVVVQTGLRRMIFDLECGLSLPPEKRAQIYISKAAIACYQNRNRLKVNHVLSFYTL